MTGEVGRSAIGKGDIGIFSELYKGTAWMMRSDAGLSDYVLRFE